eukprot:2675973-Prymnesium_polylepis.1
MYTHTVARPRRVPRPRGRATSRRPVTHTPRARGTAEPRSARVPPYLSTTPTSCQRHRRAA